jgi:hypothetical protein
MITANKYSTISACTLAQSGFGHILHNLHAAVTLDSNCRMWKSNSVGEHHTPYWSPCPVRLLL